MLIGQQLRFGAVVMRETQTENIAHACFHQQLNTVVMPRESESTSYPLPRRRVLRFRIEAIPKKVAKFLYLLHIENAS